jgi:uncharacterized protein YecT (DUF1311 family)
MRVIACLAVLGLTVAGAPARAAENSGLSAEYERCMAKAMSSADMLGCASTEIRVQDAALNTAYLALLRRLEAPRTGQLREAQREWLEFRRANCAYAANPGGGTAARVAGATCMARMTAARAREMRAFGAEAEVR